MQNVAHIQKGGWEGQDTPLHTHGTTKTIVLSRNAHSRFSSIIHESILGPPRLCLVTELHIVVLSYFCAKGLEGLGKITDA